MKKLLYASAITASFLFTGPAHADLWTLMKNSQLEETQTKSAYRVPALGFDVRAYEWSPQGNPDITCVMAFGQTHPVGMQCFETKKQ